MAQSVGEQLKQTRLARGLTLEQAAQTTRIRRHYLEALERDDRDSLPSPVQGRGFLRLYAGYLNLPAEMLVAQWEGKPLPDAQPAPVIERQPTAPEPPPLKVPQTEEPQADLSGPVEVSLDAPVETVEAPLADLAAEPPPDVSPEDVQSTEDVEMEDEPAGFGGSQPRVEKGSKEIFRDLGVTLRKQREALSLSIPDVERYTRLRQHYLRAMESGDLDELPSLEQGRGMLSNYATFLNLDAEEILLRYAEGLQQRRLEHLPPAKSDVPAARGAKQASGLRRLMTPDLLIGVSLILVLFVFVVWTAARINSIRGGELQATLPSVGEVLSETLTATPGAGAVNGTGSATGDPNPAVTATAGLPVAGPSEAPSPTLAPINSDPLQVYIVARQRAFLRVVIDGQIKFNARVVPGNAYPFSGKQTIELTSGNAAALQVFFNQQDLGTLGGEGDVLRLTFTQSGAVTPTPLPTPTVTPTVGITVTPGPSPTVATPSVTPLIP